MYTRKTADVYHVQGLYFGKWETVTTSTTRQEARQDLSDYVNNVTRYDGTPFRIIKLRRPIPATA